MHRPSNLPTHHLLTVDLEDYFQAGAFRRVISPGSWYRFESRLGLVVPELLGLLDRWDAKATFFVSGWVADHHPELVREVAAHGHEVASAGYFPGDLRGMRPDSFREDLARSREAIERATGREVLGYRNPLGLNAPNDLWVLSTLAAEGYTYDSSLRPNAHRREPHRVGDGEAGLWEFPVPAGRFPGRRPGRQTPVVTNLRAWELDPDQPRLSAIAPLSRLAHYRNLKKTAEILEGRLKTSRFRGLAEHLGLRQTHRPSSPAGIEARPQASPAGPAMETLARPPVPVTVVIPCYNEEAVLRYLANTLESARRRIGGRFDLRLIFVDDGSTDRTWRTLGEVFGSWPNATLVQHDRNRGVAAAILTGIDRAATEIVCSMDCDCTYDPHELAEMIPLLTDGVDLVTASPYHPLGEVCNVPAWRLLLSKGASTLYRRVLRQDLWTFTSCFRVYRRSAVVGLDLVHPGFLGVAEVLARMVLRGSRVAEYPTRLRVRVLGRSKMRVARTVIAHVGLLTRLVTTRTGKSTVRPASLVNRQVLAGTAVELDYLP